MKVRKTKKVVKEVDEVVESYVECDKCNKRIEICGFDAFKCNFLYQSGDSFPECTSINRTTLELCQSCARELYNTLETLGYRLNDEDIFY